MRTRRHLILALTAAVLSLGATYRTANFTVEAPNAQIAQQVGQYAEHYRKEKAELWLGHEMAQWGQPCPLQVTVTMNGSGGATSFAFDRGRILSQNMHIEGSLDRLLASVLPHEVTHTVFAYHFRQPVPRWADEGGSVLSEDDIERNRHDSLVRQILNTPGRTIPLRRLFSLKDYPSDVMCLYAQGYSVSNFLVGQSNRGTFLNFVAQGMREGWDKACSAQYGYRSVEELEQAWIESLRDTKRGPAQLVQNTKPHTEMKNAGRVVVRQTAPPAQPLQEEPTKPVYRGASPGEDDWNDPPIRPAPRRPGATASQQDRWVPSQPPSGQPNVRLGPPEYGPQPQGNRPPPPIFPE
jgi:hypothetical protein